MCVYCTIIILAAAVVGKHITAFKQHFSFFLSLCLLLISQAAIVNTQKAIKFVGKKAFFSAVCEMKKKVKRSLYLFVAALKREKNSIFS